MAVIKSLGKGFYVKGRPASYQSDGMTVGGKRGWVISSLPRSYPKTPQQIKVGRVAAECGIKKGISRAELRRKMVDCVGPKMRG